MDDALTKNNYEPSSYKLRKKPELSVQIPESVPIVPAHPFQLNVATMKKPRYFGEMATFLGILAGIIIGVIVVQFAPIPTGLPYLPFVVGLISSMVAGMTIGLCFYYGVTSFTSHAEKLPPLMYQLSTNYVKMESNSTTPASTPSPKSTALTPHSQQKVASTPLFPF